MKKIVFIAFTFLSLGLFAQIKVEERNVSINGSNSGFYITIPYGDKKAIEKELKNELKGWKGKFSDKDVMFADDCKLKDMGDNTFDAYGKVDERKEGGGYVSIAIDLGGAYLNSKEHGAQFKAMEKILHNFAVNCAKSLVDEEIKAEEKALKDKESELKDLQKEKEKKEKEIEDYKKKIKETEDAIKENEKNQGTKEEEIKTQQKVVDEVKKKKSSLK